MIGRLLQIVGINAVPVVGVVGAGWSPANALAIYWLGNFIGCVLMALRIQLHDRWTGLRGHRRPHLGIRRTVRTGVDRDPAATERALPFHSFGAEFTNASAIFVIGHLVMLVPMLLIVARVPLDPAALRQGALALLAVEVAAFLNDVRVLRTWPFRELHLRAEALFGRVALVHVSIIGGFALLQYLGTPQSFFYVFLGLKFAVDLLSLLPREARSVEGQPPPAWLRTVANAAGQPGQPSFEAMWKAEQEQRRRDEAEDEEVGPTHSAMTRVAEPAARR